MFLSSAPMLDDESAARPRPLPVNERKLRRSSADSLMVSQGSSEIQRADFNLSRRHLDCVSCVNPRAGAAGYIHHIGKARLLCDAGGRARAKAAGADDRSRLVR